MDILGDLIIGGGVAVLIYGIYRSLKANNIFMKNPSNKKDDYLGGGRH